jgi:hypothetical protein
MMPTTYWNTDFRPVVEGTYPGSPAAAAGVRVGDVVARVNGRRMLTRDQANNALKQLAADSHPASVEFLRGDETRCVHLSPLADASADRYPYKPASYPIPRDAYGLFFTGGFKLTYLKGVMDAVERRGARNVLLFVSRLMKPMYDSLAEVYPGYAEFAERVRLRIGNAPCRYWGGNVMLGDLNVVEDFAIEIRRELAAIGARPKLILLPSTFVFHRGFDVCGVHFKSLERRFGVPVDLVRCDVIMK